MKAEELNQVLKLVLGTVGRHFASFKNALMDRVKSVETAVVELKEADAVRLKAYERLTFTVDTEMMQKALEKCREELKGHLQETRSELEARAAALQKQLASYDEVMATLRNEIAKRDTTEDVIRTITPLIPVMREGITQQEVITLIEAAVLEAQQKASVEVQAISGCIALQVTQMDDLRSEVRALPAPLSLEEVARSAAALIPVPKDGEPGNTPTDEHVRGVVRELIVDHVPSMVAVLKENVDAQYTQWLLSFEQRGQGILKQGIDLIAKSLPEPKVAEVSRDMVLSVVREILTANEDITRQLVTLVESRSSSWELDFEKRASAALQGIIDRIAVPKDGKPGRDAFALDSWNVELLKDGRTMRWTFNAGKDTVTKDIPLPIMVYRGIYKAGTQYTEFDAVTRDGSVWLAARDTKSTPETDDSWRLIVKRGRDGQPGKRGAPGDKGDRGLPGVTNPFDPINGGGSQNTAQR